MNAKLTLDHAMQAQLDRLVAGDLPENDRRSLLAWLDEDAGRWRACALAFLEAQTWEAATAAWPAAAKTTAAPALPGSSQPQRGRLVLATTFDTGGCRGGAVSRGTPVGAALVAFGSAAGAKSPSRRPRPVRCWRACRSARIPVFPPDCKSPCRRCRRTPRPARRSPNMIASNWSGAASTCRKSCATCRRRSPTAHACSCRSKRCT